MTHPNHPPRPRDTRSLLGSLAVAVVMLAVLLMGTSCAPIPRAIIPPKAELAALNITPVVQAGKATRTAVRDVTSAGNATRAAGRKVSDSTRRLSDSLARAVALATANAEITAALAETRRLAAELEASVSELSAALAFAEKRERTAILAVDDMSEIINNLQAESAAQAADIANAARTEETLRTQISALAKMPDQLVIAQDKLRWWRWYGIIVSAVASFILLALIYRPRIPFIS
jgi:hypothetical protein